MTDPNAEPRDLIAPACDIFDTPAVIAQIETALADSADAKSMRAAAVSVLKQVQIDG